MSNATLSRRRASENLSNYWPLQNAKSRFSKLVRRVISEGPQHVTVHGRDEVVVISLQEFRRLKGGQTGQALVDAFQSCPSAELQIEHEPAAPRLRDAVRL